MEGFGLQPAGEYGHGTQMRHFRGEERVCPGWRADWRIEDRYEVRPGAEVSLRYVQVVLADGRRDLVVALDPEHAPDMAVQSEWELSLEGELCWVRRGRAGSVERLALCRGRRMRVGATIVGLKERRSFAEFGADGAELLEVDE